MVWPAAAAVSLSVAVGGQRVTAFGLLLVASGTMAAYGLDRLIDRRDRDPDQLRKALILCVLIASAFTGALACTAWWRFKVCLILSLIAGAYVPLKKFIPKNVLTTVAWTAAIATLPFAGPPAFDPSFRASVFSVAFIMAANTVLCDIPDVTADRTAGVRGITPRFGPRAGAIAAMMLGCLGAATAYSYGHHGLAVTASSLAVLAVFFMRDPHRGYVRLVADGLVTVLPGPLTLFFHY